MFISISGFIKIALLTIIITKHKIDYLGCHLTERWLWCGGMTWSAPLSQQLRILHPRQLSKMGGYASCRQ